MLKRIYLFIKDKIFLGAIRFYQKYISSGTQPRCRFVPTCSAYTYEAIERFGIIRGIIMGFFRILRCQPLCKGGYDPVPDKFTIRRSASAGKKDRNI